MQGKTTKCQISAVGRRRDGGTRYWCLQHRADATAKYGKRAPRCRYAHIPAVQTSETLSLNVDAFRGGVGLWGAVPPVFDTTTQGLDRGIHVHARERAGDTKQIDATFRRVRLRKGDVVVDVNELDAIYFMVSMVFGKTPQDVVCGRCDSPHLDKDWFCVHPHQTHLCAACGRNFRDNRSAVGNPVARVGTLGCGRREPVASTHALNLRQADYPGGIRIWGSNEAILWTARSPEVSGVHVHAYKDADAMPDVDETFASVTIDGVRLDPTHVRTLMAQSALPHLAGRVVSARCGDCGRHAFDENDSAYTPEVARPCRRCGGALESPGRLRKVVANPLVAELERIARLAVRPPQHHDLGLLPETL